MKKLPIFVATIIALSGAVSLSYACEFHDAPMFGAFSMQHPLMQQRHQRPAEPAQLRLSHDRYASAQVDSPEIINIHYYLPLNFRDVTLQFSSDDEIEFQQQGKVPITKLNGKYALIYTAKTAGEHVINIEAEAVRDGLPYTHVQKIRLTAQ